MPWTEAEIAAVGTGVGAIITCVVTGYLTLRKDVRKADGTTIGQWRQIVADRDRQIARLTQQFDAERMSNGNCQVLCATLKSENRYLREQLGLPPREDDPGGERSPPARRSGRHRVDPIPPEEGDQS